jgi:hypothetical protein
MGIFKSIGLFAIDIVKDIVTDTLQLKKIIREEQITRLHSTDYRSVLKNFMRIQEKI